MTAVAAILAAPIAGLFYLALGIAAMTHTATLLAGFGLRADNRDARNEVRTVYGGFPLATAAIVGISLSGTEYVAGLMLAIAIATLGMAAGRIASALVDGGIGNPPRREHRRPHCTPARIYLAKGRSQ